MHNLTIATSLERIARDENARRVDNALSNITYSYWIPASEMCYLSDTAVFNAPTFTNPPYWSFVEGSAGYVGAYIRRNLEWRAGAFTAYLHWTAAEVSTVATWRIAIDPAPLLPVAATLPAVNVNEINVLWFKFRTEYHRFNGQNNVI